MLNKYRREVLLEKRCLNHYFPHIENMLVGYRKLLKLKIDRVLKCDHYSCVKPC